MAYMWHNGPASGKEIYKVICNSRLASYVEKGKGGFFAYFPASFYRREMPNDIGVGPISSLEKAKKCADKMAFFEKGVVNLTEDTFLDLMTGLDKKYTSAAKTTPAEAAFK